MSTDHRQFSGDARIELDRGESVRVRVYISPLLCVVASVFEVVLGWRRGVPEEWVQFVRDRTHGLGLSAFQAFEVENRTVPNFLMPTPPKSTPTFADELDAFRNTPSRQIRHDLRAEFGRHVPPTYEHFQLRPQQAIARVADTFERYWQSVFEPTWPRMRAILEREVVVCGRLLATEGAIPTLARIHPAYSVRDGALTYESALPGHAATPLRDRVIALVPLIAGSNARMTSIDRPDVVLLAYAAPGTSAAWHTASISSGSALGRLVGDTRARIVEALTEPTATTMLAKQLGVAAATASHHLSALLDQGVVEQTRVGNVVYYELTERGRSLVDLFSS